MSARPDLPPELRRSLRRLAHKLLHGAATLLDLAGEPGCAREIWYARIGDDHVSPFCGTEPISSRDDEDALELLLHLVRRDRAAHVAAQAKQRRERAARERRKALHAIKGRKS